MAVKDLSRAKTRMTSLPAALRGRLASLMAVGVARALNAVVDEVVVVTTAPGIGPLLTDYGVRAEVVPDPRAGLNAAFEAGESVLRNRGHGLIVACMADLPAVTSDALTAALAQCAGDGRWFVRDATGTGTTFLAARGELLGPVFGPGSAELHAQSGAIELTADERLRRDADEARDVAAAIGLGIDSPVSALIDTGAMAQHETGVVAGPSDQGWAIVTAEGVRAYAGSSALGADVRRLAPGQRVHLARADDGRIRHLWL